MILPQVHLRNICHIHKLQWTLLRRHFLPQIPPIELRFLSGTDCLLSLISKTSLLTVCEPSSLVS